MGSHDIDIAINYLNENIEESTEKCKSVGDTYKADSVYQVPRRVLTD